MTDALVSAEEIAENANAYTPLGPRDERIGDERYVLWLGDGDDPRLNVAQRFRLRADEVEAVREEIHGHLRERGRRVCTWEVGSHATPSDLVERLRGLGLADDEPDALAVGMVLREPPRLEAPEGVEVRVAESPEERLAAERIAAAAFGGPEPEEAPPARDPSNRVYVAYLDGEPVARASAMFGQAAVSLFGGATLPAARGRGLYRALVAARWRDAVERGTPVLVTQAGAMSRPILARVGFREVCEIRILVDRF
ncbi:MAG TPA: GNAT family N-acetyltransferase [Gaiellaceae bacterium]